MSNPEQAGPAAVPKGFNQVFSEALRFKVLCPNGWKMTSEEVTEFLGYVHFVPLHPSFSDEQSFAELSYVVEYEEKCAECADYLSLWMSRLHCSPVGAPEAMPDGVVEAESTIRKGGREMKCFQGVSMVHNAFYGINLIFLPDAPSSHSGTWIKVFDALSRHFHSLCRFQIRDAIVVRNVAAYWRAAIPCCRFKAMFVLSAAPADFPCEIKHLWDEETGIHLQFLLGESDCRATLCVMPLACPNGLLGYTRCCNEFLRGLKSVENVQFRDVLPVLMLSLPSAAVIVVPPMMCAATATVVAVWSSTDAAQQQLALDFAQSMHLVVSPNDTNETRRHHIEIFAERLRSTVAIPFDDRGFSFVPSRTGSALCMIRPNERSAQQWYSTLFLVADGRTCAEWLQYVEQESQIASEKQLLVQRSEDSLAFDVPSGGHLEYFVQKDLKTQLLFGASMRTVSGVAQPVDRWRAALKPVSASWLSQFMQCKLSSI